MSDENLNHRGNGGYRKIEQFSLDEWHYIAVAAAVMVTIFASGISLLNFVDKHYRTKALAICDMVLLLGGFDDQFGVK